MMYTVKLIAGYDSSCNCIVIELYEVKNVEGSNGFCSDAFNVVYEREQLN